DRVEQGWTLMRESTPQRVVFDEPIPDGVDVIIRRASDLSEIPHVFHYTGNIKGGAEFNAKNMDENFSKILRASEDAMDSFELVGVNVEAAVDANLAADRAEAAAEDAEQSYQNTLAYDQQGEQWMLAAQAAAVEAESSKDLAYRWANEPEDQPVEQGEFSAYHWAKKAEEFVGGPYLLASNNLSEVAPEEARDNLGLGSAAVVDVVQGTGNSEDDVMSQKAVTDALNTKNTQGTGSNQTRTNSQNDSRIIQGGSVVQGTGNSTTNEMSQTAVTESITPIGMCYTQYPGTETPSTLFGGTWTLMFNTEGVFFRTEGQGASGFRDGVQGDAIRNIVGGIGPQVVGHSQSEGATGAFRTDITPNGAAQAGADRTYRSYSFDASRVVPTASENRPRNRTIRVWRKTAH